jgi:hypothetical protein
LRTEQAARQRGGNEKEDAALGGLLRPGCVCRGVGVGGR